jgi:hypothetical protein
MIPLLLTKSECAKALGLSVVSLDRLRLTGKIHARKFGHLVRFTPEDIQAFIDNSIETVAKPETARQPTGTVK